MNWKINEKNLRNLAAHLESVTDDETATHFMFHLKDFFVHQLQEELNDIREFKEY